MTELHDLESEWLSLRDMYVNSPHLGTLRQAVAAGEAYVAALRESGQPVPAKLADSLALLEDLAS